MICPLCQYNFDDRAACRGCGISKKCALIHCPHCGYEFVEKSKIVTVFSQLWQNWKERNRKDWSHAGM